MTPFEKNPNTTATYHEAIDFYTHLAAQHKALQFTPTGTTDAGYPLHAAVISTDLDFDPASIRRKGKLILLINNAIHPGEPCGVDASMLLARDYLEQPELQKRLGNIVLVIIPLYNIGGALNRNSHTRANQNGPQAYGFRGNARNLDLNRDFIKCDSRNAASFNQLFNLWQPDIFIDNHTSNGADYQYTMTLIATQSDKLERPLAQFLNENLLPGLYQKMKARSWEMTPYVYAREKPDDGIAAFLDLPRYSSGYAALFNTISFMPETHMLKPFKDRVMSTYAFMDEMIKSMQQDGKQLAAARKEAIRQTQSKLAFDLNWTMDTDRRESLLFKGYEAKYKKSEITGQDRLYYDQNAPFEKEIPYLPHYTPTLKVQKPRAYIIPQAYQKVIERLQWNGVKMQRLANDQLLEVQMYRIKDFTTTENAYEGHYLHSKVEVEQEVLQWRYFKGDYVIYTNQPPNRYIVETLEPQAPDSYFAWNFFDGILMQKEYFSPYVFEDLATQYLKEQPQLRQQFEERKKEDPEFAGSARAQLDFIYRHSPHYEPTHRRYPVGRLLKEVELELE